MNHFEKYRDYPGEVTIETTGRCNARCIFCPHNELERKHQEMSDALFLRIIEQLEEIPKDHLFYISPFKVNEILMDKKFFQRLKLINQRLPNARIRIFSNLNAATQEDIIKICQIRNLSDIDISINSLNAEEYKMLMGLDLERTLHNTLQLLDYIRTHHVPRQKHQIVLSRVSQSPESDQQYIDDFQKIFRDYLDLAVPLVIPRGEWIDFIPTEQPLKQNQPCYRWTDINICCTGEVAFCCMDGRASYSLGNVSEQTALEIYNQPSYRRLRTMLPHKCLVEPCNRCSQ